MALSTLQPFSLQTWEWYGLSYLLVKQEVNKHITRYVWPSLKTWWIMLHYFLQFERVLIPGVNDRCVFCPLESVSERHVVTLWNSRRSARLDFTWFLCSFFRYSNNISPKKMKLTLVPPATSMLELHRTGAVWLRLHNELTWLGWVKYCGLDLNKKVV